MLKITTKIAYDNRLSLQIILLERYCLENCGLRENPTSRFFDPFSKYDLSLFPRGTRLSHGRCETMNSYF